MNDARPARRPSGAAPLTVLACLAVFPVLPALGSTLSGPAIDAVIHKHLKSIQLCYDHELDTKPALKGKIVVLFSIEADGRVPSAAVDSSDLDDSELESCVCGEFEAMVFPRHAGDPIAVHYPVTFQPEKK